MTVAVVVFVQINIVLIAQIAAYHCQKKRLINMDTFVVVDVVVSLQKEVGLIESNFYGE
jgi:hypothetical protein